MFRERPDQLAVGETPKNLEARHPALVEALAVVADCSLLRGVAHRRLLYPVIYPDYHASGNGHFAVLSPTRSSHFSQMGTSGAADVPMVMCRAACPATYPEGT